MNASQTLADSTDTPSRSRRLQALTWIGLGFSVFSLLVVLPTLVDQSGGASSFAGDLALLLWTPCLVVALCALTRTLGPRALLGALFAGFFGTVSLATMVGRPVIDRLGADSSFAVVLWAPLTEELLKLAPVALVLFVCRNRAARPSTGDLTLYGAAIGLGFTVHENALLGRNIDGGWFAHLPFSVLVPSLTTVSNGAESMVVGGHMVYTALAALGLAVTMTYRRVPWARLAAPVAFGVVLLEHATVNQLALTTGDGDLPAWAQVGHAITLGGHLSVVLLLAGLAIVTWHESQLLHVSSSADSLLRTWCARVFRPAAGDVVRRSTVMARATKPVERTYF